MVYVRAATVPLTQGSASASANRPSFVVDVWPGLRRAYFRNGVA